MPYIQSIWLSMGGTKLSKEYNPRKRVIQCIPASWKVERIEGTTIMESPCFNSLDIVTHNDRHETTTLQECLPLDYCDAVIDNHMSDVFGNFLVVETLIDVKLHCTFYTVWLTWLILEINVHYESNCSFASWVSEGRKHDNNTRSMFESCSDWDISRLVNRGVPLRRILPRYDEVKNNRNVSTLCEVMPISIINSLHW